MKCRWGQNTIIKMVANMLVSLSFIVAVSPASIFFFHQPKCPKQLR